MVDGSDHHVSKTVAEWVDQLATQLILNTHLELSTADLDHLQALGIAEGRIAIGARAAQVAAQIAAGSVAPNTAEFITALISELRVLTEDNADGANTRGLNVFAADPEMLGEFITEAREHLVAVEEKMLLIESDAADLESINAVFRAFHTIKGLAGFLELHQIQQVAHEIETLLDLARTQKLIISSPVVDAVFDVVDFIRTVLASIEAQTHGGVLEGPTDAAQLLLCIKAAGQSATAKEMVREETPGHSTESEIAAPVIAPPTTAIETPTIPRPAAIPPSDVSKPQKYASRASDVRLVFSAYRHFQT